MQGDPELNHLLWGLMVCVLIKNAPRKVKNKVWASPVLWNDGHWGQPSIRKFADSLQGKEDYDVFREVL